MERNIDHFHQVGNVYDTICIGVAVGEIEVTHRQLEDVVHYRHHVNYINKTVIVDIAKKFSAVRREIQLFWQVMPCDVKVAGVVGDVFQCHVAMGVILVVHGDESEFVITEHTHSGGVETCTVI